MWTVSPRGPRLAARESKGLPCWCKRSFDMLTPVKVSLVISTIPYHRQGDRYTCRKIPMCDYSLHAVASRPAKVGETLVTTGFPGTPTRGFAAREERTVAACLLPGTELAFEDEIKYDRTYLLSRCALTRNSGFTVARFRRIEPRSPFLHRDALSFPDGTIVLVNMLSEGQCARVLQLPVISQEKSTVIRDDQGPLLDVYSLV
jgi:hypothetical protein